MKKNISILLIFLLGIANVFAQTASDYYIPLRVGNYLKYHTSAVPPGSNWGARTATSTIEGSNSISGRIYFREKSVEVLDNNQSNIYIVHVFWLRKDSVGNVALGALNTTGSSNVDSATILNGKIFYNEFLTKGYSISQNWGNKTITDSIVSVSETVSAAGKTFYNCITLSESHIDSTGTAVQQDFSYYAYGVGLVKNQRTIPLNQANTSELIEYVTTGISEYPINSTPQKYSLSQNYPNPFNPSTVIRYQLPVNSSVTLKVYDVIGREVAIVVNEVKEAGSHTVQFNGSSLSSGVYFYTLKAGSFTTTKKLLLMK